MVDENLEPISLHTATFEEENFQPLEEMEPADLENVS